MTSSAFGTDQHRTRIALTFLIIGLLFVLFAWANWIYRTSTAHEESAAVRVEAGERLPPSTKVVRSLPLFLLVGLLLVLVFLVGSYVIVRSGRRYRAMMGRQRAAPSSMEDVWAMHQAPQDSEDDADES